MRRSGGSRVQGLMLARVLIVTALLGSALFLDVDALSDLSNPGTATELGIIVGTYALTIAYALAVRAGVTSRRFVPAQLALDVLLCALLVLATGGLRQSVFIFTIYLPIIGAALVAGRAAALWCATAVAAILVYLSGIDLLLWSAPSPFARPNIHAPTTGLLFEASLKISFAYLLAWVSGQLAAQLGAAEQEIARQQLSLRDLRTLNEDILSSLQSGLVTLDASGRIIFFNRAAELITGLRAADTFGLPVEAVFAESDTLLRARDPAERMIERRLEQPYRRADGQEIYLGFSISPLRHAGAGERGQIVIFQDLTEIKALEAQAKRAERLATLGQLAAAMAHEIRNPLAAISGSVEMLEMLATLTDDERALMQIILREVGRLNELITQFLDYSKPRSLRLEQVDVEVLIEDVLTLCRHRAPGVTLELVRQDEARAEVRADREALQQVIWNLLNNAVEAMSPLEGQGEPAGAVRVELGWEEALLRIAVEDDGEGIPEALREQLFEPFFTTKAKGTGLGLAIIARLIEDHGGVITLEPPQSLRGARFVVRLPRAPG
jgi:two-component system, NtrC family, sensor histidine kinase PilS